MRYYFFVIALFISVTGFSQAEKLCTHEMDFTGDVYVKANLPCAWKKDKITGNEETRKFLYTANGINYTAVVVVSRLPMVPDSITRVQMISEEALREAGKGMGTVLSAGKIKMGSLPAGELILKGVKGSGVDKKYAYMLQCYAVIDDKLVVVNMGVIAANENLAQTTFEKNKPLFRQYVNKMAVEVDYSKSLMR